MKLKVDKEIDALYFRLDESAIVESEEVQPGVILDFNADGHVVGVEMLEISKGSIPNGFALLSSRRSENPAKSSEFVPQQPLSRYPIPCIVLS